MPGARKRRLVANIANDEPSSAERHQVDWGSLLWMLSSFGLMYFSEFVSVVLFRASRYYCYCLSHAEHAVQCVCSAAQGVAVCECAAAAAQWWVCGVPSQTQRHSRNLATAGSLYSCHGNYIRSTELTLVSGCRERR